jgi:hypothetical protein
MLGAGSLDANWETPGGGGACVPAGSSAQFQVAIAALAGGDPALHQAASPCRRQPGQPVPGLGQDSAAMHRRVRLPGQGSTRPLQSVTQQGTQGAGFSRAADAAAVAGCPNRWLGRRCGVKVDDPTFPRGFSPGSCERMGFWLWHEPHSLRQLISRLSANQRVKRCPIDSRTRSRAGDRVPPRSSPMVLPAPLLIDTAARRVASPLARCSRGAEG